MIRSTTAIAGKGANISVVKNTLNYNDIEAKGALPVEFDDYTKSTASVEELCEALASGAKKFISVGRFSPEKAHDRLIKMFAKYLKKEPDSYLIIIGGSDRNCLKSLIELKDSLGIGDRVILICRMSNPYSILARCDYFILSSLYEGFGLVLAEADILGKPVISTDIEGPRLFMQKHGGTMVECSDEGVYQGFVMLGEGKVKPMGVDYEKYNLEAVEEFEKVLS